MTNQTTLNKYLDMPLHFRPPDPLLPQEFCKHPSAQHRLSYVASAEDTDNSLSYEEQGTANAYHPTQKSQLQTMHLLQTKVWTSTLGKINQLLHLPVMLQSFVDTNKPLRGNNKGVQTWC